MARRPGHQALSGRPADGRSDALISLEFRPRGLLDKLIEAASSSNLEVGGFLIGEWVGHRAVIRDVLEELGEDRSEDHIYLDLETAIRACAGSWPVRVIGDWHSHPGPGSLWLPSERDHRAWAEKLAVAGGYHWLALILAPEVEGPAWELQAWTLDRISGPQPADLETKRPWRRDLQ